MKHLGFHYQVEFRIRLSGAELNLLQVCSQKHYDFKCRSASECGNFLYGMFNRFNGCFNNFAAAGNQPTPLVDKELEFTLSWDELDCLTKIAEGGTHLSLDIHDDLWQALHSGIDETAKVNAVQRSSKAT